jgi:arylsulfatase A-like enzyme
MKTINRRDFLKTTTAAAAALTLPAFAVSRASAAKRPNIVFIMADDHASHAISAYGGKLNKTPNIDRLAKEGMRFTNCFNVNSLCAPSRAALITGRYSHHNGYFRNREVFNGDQVTFPKLLQSSGYETAIIGKWHLGSQPTGFDHYSVIPSQGRFFDCPFRDSTKPWDTKTVVKGYLTDVITDKAIDWMQNRDSSKPFCLMVHHKAPHTAHHYPKEYEKLYAEADLPYPENFDADYQDRSKAFADTPGRWSKIQNMKPGHCNKKIPEGLKVGTIEYKKWSYQTFFKGYLRLVAALDKSIGKLLDHIDKSSLAENTIVVYTSDNGFFLGDFGLFNKMWMYEESLRLPLLMRYRPEVKAASVNDDFISILDFAPTFLDYAGAQAPGILQGRSIRSILNGKTPDDWRKYHYYHYYGQAEVPAHYGVRSQRYKLIYYYEQDCWEFFDLKNDPREMQNLYGKAEHLQAIESAKTILKQLRKKYEDAGV